MTYPALENVDSRRFTNLATKLGDKKYRDGYVAGQLRIWLAEQVRALRGDMTQSEFGKLIGKPQTIVSRLEDPNYGNITLQTLLDVASKLDIALIVRFADYPTFLIHTNDFSDAALCPAPFNQGAVNNVAHTMGAGANVTMTFYSINSGSNFPSGSSNLGFSVNQGTIEQVVVGAMQGTTTVQFNYSGSVNSPNLMIGPARGNLVA